MRMLRLILQDIRFQWNYGFYYLYFFVCLVYMTILFLIPAGFQAKICALVIFSDPATLGVIFIGAIILFEKGEHVLSSLAVSPVKVEEYVVSKVISLSLLALLSAGVLSLVFCREMFFPVLLGVFLGSVVFTLIGIVIVSRVNSVNQFLIVLILVMMMIMLPALCESFGLITWLMPILPGNAVLRLIEGQGTGWQDVVCLLGWTCLCFAGARCSVISMLKREGGVSL